MFTTVLDSLGYCRIGSTVAARRPIKRISRLTTTDKTGRLMKISVMAIANHPAKYALDRVSLPRPKSVHFSSAHLAGPAPAEPAVIEQRGLVTRPLPRTR